MAGHLLVTHTSLQAVGNIVTTRSEIQEDAIRALGIDRLVEGSIAMVRNGR